MGNYSSSPLRKAIRSRNPERVKKILDEAGDGAGELINDDYTSSCVCYCGRDIQNPLHTCIGMGDWPMVKILLDYGADPNIPGLWGQTALHRAARANAQWLAELLIDKHGAELYARDTDGRYPIHSAALSPTASGKDFTIEALEYLYKIKGKPSDLTLTDNYGNTPLHVAATFENPLAVRYLLKQGSDPEVQNGAGQMPIDIAKPKSKEILLRSHSRKSDKRDRPESSDRNDVSLTQL